MRPIDADAALKALRKCQTYLYDARDPELKIELSSAEAAINNLPSIQPERAIPLSWIENEIKWLKSLDNTFSEITALQISAMVNKWRDEQNETD